MSTSHRQKQKKQRQKRALALFFHRLVALSSRCLASPWSRWLNEGKVRPKKSTFRARESSTPQADGRSDDDDDGDRFAAGVRRPRRLIQAAASAAARASSVSPCSLQGLSPSGGGGALGKRWKELGESIQFFCRLHLAQHFSTSSLSLFSPTPASTVPRRLGPRLAGPESRSRRHVGRGPGAGRGRVPPRRIRHEPQGLSLLYLFFSFFLFSLSPSLSHDSRLFPRCFFDDAKKNQLSSCERP